jgi:LysR family cyn operon transcriptional activator
MDLRRLRYFAAVAEQLNFTRAAELMHVTQSTLSHQIKQLEAEVGHRLFDRNGKRVVITEIGEQLLPKFKRALQDIDDSIRGVQGKTLEFSGHLRLGVTHSLNISLIPKCVAELFKRHPTVKVSIKELSADTIARSIESDELDMGITYRPRNGSLLSFEPLCHDEMALIVPPEHPFASRRRVRMSELHQQQLILYTKNTATQEFLDGWFKSVGAEPIVLVEMNACAPMPALVRNLGVPAIVSRLGFPDAGDLTIVPIENPTPLRTPGILWRSAGEPTPEAKSLAGIVRRAMISSDSTRPKTVPSKKERPAFVRIPPERQRPLVKVV